MTNGMKSQKVKVSDGLGTQKGFKFIQTETQGERDRRQTVREDSVGWKGLLRALANPRIGQRKAHTA